MPFGEDIDAQAQVRTSILSANSFQCVNLEILFQIRDEIRI